MPEKKLSYYDKLTETVNNALIKFTDSKHQERVDEELEIIRNMDDPENIAHQFLFTSQLIASMHMMVGPGCGNMCSSLINYLLSITDIDPIKYKLNPYLFFRSNMSGLSWYFEVPDGEVDSFMEVYERISRQENFNIRLIVMSNSQLTEIRDLSTSSWKELNHPFEVSFDHGANLRYMYKIMSHVPFPELEYLGTPLATYTRLTQHPINFEEMLVAYQDSCRKQEHDYTSFGPNGMKFCEEVFDKLELQAEIPKEKSVECWRRLISEHASQVPKEMLDTVRQRLKAAHYGDEYIDSFINSLEYRYRSLTPKTNIITPIMLDMEIAYLKTYFCHGPLSNLLY